MIASAIIPGPRIAIVLPANSAVEGASVTSEPGPGPTSSALSRRRRSARWFGGVHRRSGGRAVRVPGRVDRGERGPFGRQLVLGKDGVHRALGLTGAAIDALVGIDVELPVDALFVVDAV